MDFSNYLANKLVDATVRNIAYTTPAVVYLALYTTDPTKEDVGSEVDQASYTRQPVTFTEPEDGISSNANQVDWSEATSNWGLVTHIGIRDEAGGGNLLYFKKLDNAKHILTGDKFRVDVERLNLQLT